MFLKIDLHEHDVFLFLQTTAVYGLDNIILQQECDDGAETCKQVFYGLKLILCLLVKIKFKITEILLFTIF